MLKSKHLREFTSEEEKRYSEACPKEWDLADADRITDDWNPAPAFGGFAPIVVEAPTPDKVESFSKNLARHCALPADTKITWDW